MARVRARRVRWGRIARRRAAAVRERVAVGWACGVVAALLGSCAGFPVASEPICDGSDGLRLAYRTTAPQVWRVPSTLKVRWEPGISFLYVDGRCRFWVRPDDGYDETADTGISRDWYVETREGVLTAEEADALGRDLGYGDWGGLDREVFDGARVTEPPHTEMWADGQYFRCVGPLGDCGSEVPTTLVQRAEAWADRLYDRAAPMTGPIRGRAFVWDDAAPGIPRPIPVGAVVARVGWHSMLLDSAVSLGDGELLDYGGAPLITDPDEVALWRGLWRDFIHNEHAYWSGPFVVDAAGTIYQFSIRDALPFEDEDGLVTSIH
jgi:hypothetical protein